MIRMGEVAAGSVISAGDFVESFRMSPSATFGVIGRGVSEGLAEGITYGSTFTVDTGRYEEEYELAWHRERYTKARELVGSLAAMVDERASQRDRYVLTGNPSPSEMYAYIHEEIGMQWSEVSESWE